MNIGEQEGVEEIEPVPEYVPAEPESEPEKEPA